MAARGDSPKGPDRFYELDILRGLAAIIVVTFHYKHFLLISDRAGFDYHDMPLHAILMPVYVYGQFFVELFFSISGYVFFWLYAEAISARRIGLRGFFVARFARLYPLYFVTFIAVALIQWAFHGLYGHDYIYGGNTFVNFALNLVMAHQWLPHAVQNFNGPSWSISVEVFLYAVFFLLCRFRLQSVWTVAALSVAGLFLRGLNPDTDFMRGLPSFFLGGLVWYFVTELRRHDVLRRRLAVALAAVLPVLWGLTYVWGYDSLWLRITQALSRHGVHWPPVTTVGAFCYVLIPLTLLFFGLQRGLWLKPERLKRFEWVGDISYSVYLIHFPLQISLMLVLAQLPFAARARIFSSPFAYLAFMAAAMGLAWLSYRYFETPMRKHIREWLAPRLARLRPLR